MIRSFLNDPNEKKDVPGGRGGRGLPSLHMLAHSVGQLCTGTTDILEGRGGDSPPYICWPIQWANYDHNSEEEWRMLAHSVGFFSPGTTDILEGRGGDSPPYICSEEEECVEDGIYLAQRIETVWAPHILSSPHTASNHSPLSLWAERDSLQCGGGRAHTCTVQEPRRAGRPGRGAPRPEGGPEEEHQERSL